MVLQNFVQDVFESIPQDVALSLPVCKETTLEIKFGNNDDLTNINLSSAPPLPFANSCIYEANILHWRRLTKEDEKCKAVYELTFDVKNSDFVFRAGDTIGIKPQNDAEEVKFILSQLDLSCVADCSYKLSSSSQKNAKIPAHIPLNSSLRHVLTHCVDLRTVLKKLFILALSKHTKDKNEKRILEYFCSKEGTAAYQRYILDRNLCLIDLLAIFKTCKPPIQIILAHLPRLLPRPYSIVNSGIKNSNILKICFSVLPLANNKKGLTTGWLEKLILNQESDLVNKMTNLTITNDCDMKYKVPIYLRKNLSEFLLPSMETPLILIGPGTGISPFIGFLEERENFLTDNPGSKIGEACLFFGCRHPKLDFIYEREINEFLSKGVLQKVFTAFSRMENNGTKYIQDSLKQNSEDIVRLIESNASIFICGDISNMATQVKEALVQCLVNSCKTLDEANKIIADLQKQNRYVVDAWS